MLCALVVAGQVPVSRPLLQLGAGVVGGIFPLGWLVAGYAFEYGFFNSTVAFVALISCWLIWQRSAQRPVVAVCLLLVAALVLLGSWAPLAVLSGALAVALAWRYRRSIFHSARSRLIVLVFGLVLAAYAVLFTLPDILREGSFLSGEGGVFALSPITVGLAAAVCGCLTFVNRRLSANQRLNTNQNDWIGFLAVLLAAVPALGFFLWVRRAEESPWGYYPTKFAWVLCVLFILISLGAVARALANSSKSMGPRVLFSAAAVVALATVVVQTLPTRPGLLLPVVDVWRGWQGSDRAEWASTLFALDADNYATSTGRSFAVQLDGPEADAFYNQWLLQINLVSGTDPVRNWAYSFDSSSPDSVCALAEVVGGGATAYTRNPALAAAVASVCGSELVTVVDWGR